MATKKKTTPKEPEPTRWEFETLNKPSAYHINQMKQDEPSCWNGDVTVVKYRVLIEKVEEPVEAIHARITKLWRECDNYHNWDPIKAAAAKHGLLLNSEDMGVDRKKKTS